jgi:CheY-like chemotaxis protein
MKFFWLSDEPHLGRGLMSKRKTRVLLVDDDPSLRQLLTAVLTRLGYAVRSAHDGFSALAAIRTVVPDILLSDLYMPTMSGFELLSVVRRRFPGISVIAMSSAYAGPNVPAGVAADAFYEKATNLHDLLAFVDGMGVLRGGRPVTRRKSVSPLWIAGETDGNEGRRIALSCPECMRTSFEVPGDSPQVVREAGCLYCSARIPYALVSPRIPYALVEPGEYPTAEIIALRMAA